jgi:hypothetical protein
MEHKKFTIVVIAAVTSLLLAGIVLTPIQSYATRSSGGIPDTSSLKHGIRDGVTVNLEHRSQHMDQENLCYRANTCRQANDGQNTLGNDNSVTGFTDQSDNLQQAAAAPGNNTTPTPTPTPRTCEECFASLNSTQTTALLSTFSVSSLADLCTRLGTPVSEVAFLTILSGPSVGVDPTIASEIVACLKAAGIVFNP